MLTNQNSAKTFVEPRLLIVADPRIDYNALVETTYVNIPIIALCNTDNNLAYVDCAIPCNNRSKFSLAMVMWILTKEVLALRNEESNFNDMPDLFMWRDVEKERKEEKQAEEVQMMDGDEVEGEGEEQFLDDDAQQ
jgi:small subunit ribosomal protein SAe